MAGHTRGPWGIEQTASTNWVGPLRFGGDKIEVIVAGIDRAGLRDDARDIRDANARLIAAAPTLAAACLSMLATAGSGCNWNGATRESLLLIETALDAAGMGDDAIAAIAKAEEVQSLGAMKDYAKAMAPEDDPQRPIQEGWLRSKYK